MVSHDEAEGRPGDGEGKVGANGKRSDCGSPGKVPEDAGGSHPAADEPEVGVGRLVRPRRRGSKSSPLRDSEALAKLGVAAKAAGLTLEDLVNLVVDSGALTLPSDGITQKFTLKDLGLALWTDLQKVPKTVRCEWYKKLTPVQQKAVIVTLKDRGYASWTISTDLGISQDEVMRTWSKHADELGAQVVGMRLTTIAGQLHLAAERAQNGAAEQGDNRLLWQIAKDLVKAYADLGIVDRAVHKVEVTHKFDEQKQAEIDAMLELQDMERKRDEELKKIEVGSYDEAPPLEDYDT
jgi:hypothetical protein